ncbi:hypothetical protein TMPK1_01780 [Rhodospirillales bacterium TMPK1]|uniref:Uncharacterized protein n=2 Tax=Roseiterribacter gracilis TaxID=2812848 RepID=A0A8S8X842_9PROT|nr:hypothetical protein TMPK1_01780 [Rhodospirillales bacterium TMPK1]
MRTSRWNALGDAGRNDTIAEWMSTGPARADHMSRSFDATESALFKLRHRAGQLQESHDFTIHLRAETRLVVREKPGISGHKQD